MDPRSAEILRSCFQIPDSFDLDVLAWAPMSEAADLLAAIFPAAEDSWETVEKRRPQPSARASARPATSRQQRAAQEEIVDLLGRARAHYSVGNKVEASQYARRARLGKAAYARQLEGVVCGEGASGTIDLHGHSAETALAELRARLRVVLAPAEVTVITGRGNNSIVKGRSSVYSCVSHYLFSIGVPFRVDDQNAGRLIVTVSRSGLFT